MRLIVIIEHVDPVDGAQVQVPEHVTARKTRQQQLLRVVPVGIAAKSRIVAPPKPHRHFPNESTVTRLVDATVT